MIGHNYYKLTQVHNRYMCVYARTHALECTRGQEWTRTKTFSPPGYAGPTDITFYGYRKQAIVFYRCNLFISSA